MSRIDRNAVEHAIADYRDPYLECDLVSAKAVRNIECSGERVSVHVELGFPARGYLPKLSEALRTRIQSVDGVSEVEVHASFKVVTHEVQKGLKPLPGVRNVVAVASGKGGVGKSTTAVNLALALQAEGGRVGILDADIYGPSQPLMLGSDERPEVGENSSLRPITCHGLQSMSIGYLIDEETPMVWRGPMVTQALQQLLNQTAWDDLDYLVIDLPPGTGDIQLTLSQKVPVSGAVIVTTPQDIALLDARKGLKMFEKVEVPVLGVVENMSMHICSQCGHAEPIFGQGGGERMASDYGVQLLGQLPLALSIREQADGGCPTVAADPDGDIAAIYREVARRTAAKLALRAKSYAHKFPKIVIQNG